MKIALPIAASLFVLCGCDSSRQSSSVELIARSLAQAWPRANPHLELKLRATEINGKVILHSTLKNTSDAAVKLNRSRLPWTSPSWLGVDAITANGEMLPRPPPPAEISVIEGAPSEIVINPGEILEGNVDLASGPLIPISELPKNVDIFLVWSYSLEISAPGENPFFSGITLLKRRS